MALLAALGLLGILLPAFPGLPLIWGAALLYGIAEGFDGGGTLAFVAISVVFAVGTAFGFLLPQRRATAAGAPRSTIVAGGVLGIIGFFVIPIIGLPVGAAAGVLLAEYRRDPDWQRAWRTTREVLVGFGFGKLVELGAGIAMAVLLALWIFFW